MHFKTILAAATAACLIGGAAQAACPSTPYNYGSGNDYVPCNAEVSLQNGVELSLRAHERTKKADPAIGGMYFFDLGQDVGIDFGVNTFGTYEFASFAGIMLTVQDYANSNTQSFDVRLIPDNANNGGYFLNNSEALVFGFMDQFYDKDQHNTFDITLATMGNGDPRSLTIRAVQGDGAAIAAIPEPATWAMMILGFAGAGAALRRRRLAVAI